MLGRLELAFNMALDLITLVRSKTESTRNQALDVIISLAGKSDFFLELLREVNAAEVIKGEEINVWKFYDTSVQINSRMALTCVQDGKLFQLLKEYKAPAYTGTSLTAFIRYGRAFIYLCGRRLIIIGIILKILF